MKPLGFGYVCNSCKGLGDLDKSPAFKPGEYKFKALKDVSNIGEAWQYIYQRWEEASKVTAAKQAVEIYEEVFNGLTAEFKKAVEALDWTQSEKEAKDKSLVYVSQWPAWKGKLNTAWNILEQARGGGKAPDEPKPQEASKEKNGKKEPVEPAPATTTTDLKPPPKDKAFPWWMIGAGAAGLGLVILLLGMRKKSVTANLQWDLERNSRKRRHYSPGVGRYVRKEMHKIGKSPHVQSRAQAIAVGLSRARAAGLRVPPPLR